MARSLCIDALVPSRRSLYHIPLLRNNLLRQKVKQQKAQAECYCSQPHGQWKAQLVLSGTHPILREILHTIQEWLSLEMLDVRSSPKLCSLSTWEFVNLLRT